MNGIEQVMVRLDGFTQEQRTTLDKIRYATFYDRRWDVSPGELNRFSTREGIIQQLAEFVAPEGIVYHIDFTNGQPTMMTICHSKQTILEVRDAHEEK